LLEQQEQKRAWCLVLPKRYHSSTSNVQAPTQSAQCRIPRRRVWNRP
jgi:hypothetical protein